MDRPACPVPPTRLGVLPGVCARAPARGPRWPPVRPQRRQQACPKSEAPPQGDPHRRRRRVARGSVGGSEPDDAASNKTLDEVDNGHVHTDHGEQGSEPQGRTESDNDHDRGRTVGMPKARTEEALPADVAAKGQGGGLGQGRGGNRRARGDAWTRIALEAARAKGRRIGETRGLVTELPGHRGQQRWKHPLARSGDAKPSTSAGREAGDRSSGRRARHARRPPGERQELSSTRAKGSELMASARGLQKRGHPGSIPAPCPSDLARIAGRARQVGAVEAWESGPKRATRPASGPATGRPDPAVRSTGPVKVRDAKSNQGLGRRGALPGRRCMAGWCAVRLRRAKRYASAVLSVRCCACRAQPRHRARRELTSPGEPHMRPEGPSAIAHTVVSTAVASAVSASSCRWWPRQSTTTPADYTQTVRRRRRRRPRRRRLHADGPDDRPPPPRRRRPPQSVTVDRRRPTTARGPRRSRSRARRPPRRVAQRAAARRARPRARGVQVSTRCRCSSSDAPRGRRGRFVDGAPPPRRLPQATPLTVCRPPALVRGGSRECVGRPWRRSSRRALPRGRPRRARRARMNGGG